MALLQPANLLFYREIRDKSLIWHFLKRIAAFCREEACDTGVDLVSRNFSPYTLRPINCVLFPKIFSLWILKVCLDVCLQIFPKAQLENPILFGLAQDDCQYILIILLKPCSIDMAKGLQINPLTNLFYLCLSLMQDCVILASDLT